MVFRGLSTRRTRRDLMVLMSLPLVPLQGRKGHKNNRGNHLLPRSLSGRFVGVQGGFGGGIAWVWGCSDSFCVHPRQGCRQDEPASPGMSQQHRGEGWGRTRSWQGSAVLGAGQGPGKAQHSCWPGFVTSQPLLPRLHSWTTLPARTAAPAQEAQLLQPIPTGKGTKPHLALLPSWMSLGVFMDGAGGVGCLGVCSWMRQGVFGCLFLNGAGGVCFWMGLGCFWMRQGVFVPG